MCIARRTPEEAAGKARYKEDMRKAYLERNRERIEARMKSYNERRKEENEKRFREGLLELAAKDPAAAEKLRKKHEKLRWIRSLSHEERVRYVQQKLYDRLKARAEREAAIAAAKAKREADEKARRKAIRNGTAKLLRYDRRAIERHAKAVAAEKRRERLEASRSRRAAEKALAEKYRLEREANLRAYLASKNRPAEGEGMP